MPESRDAVQRVLVKAEAARKRVAVPEPDRSWKYIGWLGLVLALAGLTDLGLAMYPLRFGNPDWEFGTIANVTAGLPLTTLGLAGLFGSGMALGRRWLLVLVGAVLAVGASVVAVLLLVFLTDVPMALRSVEGPVLTGVKKAIVKTVALGLYFGVAYTIGAFWALRSSLGRPSEETT